MNERKKNVLKCIADEQARRKKAKISPSHAMLRDVSVLASGNKADTHETAVQLHEDGEIDIIRTINSFAYRIKKKI